MAANNNQTSSPSNPIGTASDTSQQSWVEVDQQGLGGETLSAKKWSTKRRIVDSSQHVGNIHTGTEKAVELDKSNTLSGDTLENQTPREDNTSEAVTHSDPNLQTSTNTRFSVDSFGQDEDKNSNQAAETTPLESDHKSVIASSGSDSLVFEKHFEDDSNDRSPQRDQSKAPVSQQTTIPQTSPEPVQETSSEAISAAEVTTTPTAPPSTSVTSTSVTSAPVTSTPPLPLPEVEDDDGSTTIIVESTASAPILNAADSTGIEDTAIALDFSSNLTDTDGSESLLITVEGVPIGAELSAGKNLGTVPGNSQAKS